MRHIMRIGTFLFCGLLLSAYSFSEDLLLGENETKTVPPGAHKYTRVELGKDSTLIFTNSTSIIVDRFKSADGAKIEYDSPEYNDTDLFFELNALDASGVQQLTVIGNGKAGITPEGNVKPGSNGRGAIASSMRYPFGRESEPGRPGSPGANGQPGESAADIMLKLPKLSSGAKLNITSVGGDGGNGQTGGSGGNGGAAAATRSFSCGGKGGPGGNGGNGGDSGKVYIFLVVDDANADDQDFRRNLIESTQITFNLAAGSKGTGGQPGRNGDDGEGTAWIDNSRCSGTYQPPVSLDGQNGDGPTGDSKEEWSRVDVLPMSQYQQFIVQTLQSLK